MLEELRNECIEAMKAFLRNAGQVEEGTNKKAGRQSRKDSLIVEKLMKQWRSESIDAEKQN
jgi:ATP-dependent phosphoenolpyruvate carboxykinase